MLNILKRFMGGLQDEEFQSPNPPSPSLHVATCAIFLEMANIDGEFSDNERQSIIGMFKSEYGLPERDIDELLDTSRRELHGSVGLWHFTNIINQKFTIEEKIRVVELVWKIVYADGNLDKHEDYLAHKIGKLLRLTHRQLIDAKLRVLHS